MTDTPVTFLNGYLGAGKTTLLNDVLRNPQGLAIFVLVNDFGEINIDQSLIQSADKRIMSLTNGCACCAIQDDLVDALLSLTEDERQSIDAIIIEASGVAQPPRLKQVALNLPGYRYQQAVTTYDISAISRLLRDKFVQHTVKTQLLTADQRLETKADVLNDEELLTARRQFEEFVEWPKRISREDFLANLRGQLSGHLAYAPDTQGSQENHDIEFEGGWIPETQLNLEHCVDLLRAEPAGLERVKGLVKQGAQIKEIQYSSSGLVMTDWKGSNSPSEFGLQYIATSEFNEAEFLAAVTNRTAP